MECHHLVLRRPLVVIARFDRGLDWSGYRKSRARLADYFGCCQGGLVHPDFAVAGYGARFTDDDSCFVDFSSIHATPRGQLVAKIAVDFSVGLRAWPWRQ